ncbi:MAG: preprotein translocase subunit SecA [Firmicutes bacterium]|nr:preprotein translocase subunit SecA [Bacillota bacterium]MDY5677117.1 preprotein translocase subunit SecA [Eubacteriales bacterium]
MGFWSKIFKSDNTRNVEKLEKIAKKVEDLQDKYRAYSDEDLKNTTTILKQRLADGEKTIDILPDAFACVREASSRVIGKRHYHVQVLGGIALFQGRIAEMKTGEGKTLVETLPAYLVALEGKGVHIVTVNEYLSTRDAEWMGKIFKFLGLTVGINTHDMTPDKKKEAYACDITYSTNNELGFDYLRDNMVMRPEDRVARGYHFAIIDEVDSILIDEARTPLIISGKGMKSSEDYKKASRFAKSLKPTDYEIDEKEKAIRLNENGIAKAERYFAVDNLSDINNIELNHYINNALKAQYIMLKDNNYIVKDGEVVIVDEFTGRLMEGRKYSNGLHQAIEAKEGLEVRDENKTLATITFQNFFRIYDKISGMTGTAKTEETEFNKIYNLDVVTIPTNKPVRRIDWTDIIYPTEKAKINAIVEEVKKVHAEGRPILVGTITIEKSEEISKELKQAKIKHNVLNAKNHQKESMIIAQAGRLGQVTIATNMAGRGTDIMLGGNPEYLAKQKMQELGYTDEQIEFCTSYLPSDSPELEKAREKYKKYYKEFEQVTDDEKQKVIQLGGLHIIGTERHESRRIDNQLRGRAGRQGDPGSSVFYVSMEDELMRRFGGDKLQGVVRFFKISDDTAFTLKFLARQIEAAQRRIEGFNFSARHTVLKFDDVNNQQRKEIYKERNRVLDGADVHDEVLDMIAEFARNTVLDSLDGVENWEEWNIEKINSNLNNRVLPADANFVTEEMVEGLESSELAEKVAEKAKEVYDAKCKSLNAVKIDSNRIEREILLRVVDSLWRDHIDFMEILRGEIGLRAYGNHDPLIAYKEESSRAYEEMVSRVREETAMFLLNFKVQIERTVPIHVTKKDLTPEDIAKIRKIAEDKIREQKAGGVNPTTAPNNSKAQDDLDKLMKAPTSIDMVTNMTENTQAKTKGKAVGRNDLCPCGSGLKYKNCCGKNAK